MIEGSCVIGGSVTAILSPTSGDRAHVQCEVRGTYEITRTLIANLRNRPDERLRAALSAHTRQASELGEKIILSTSNVDSLATAHMNTSVSRKLDLTLRLVADRSKWAGNIVKLNEQTTYPLVDALSPNELNYCLHALRDRGDLGLFGCDEWLVTPCGWDRLQPPGHEAVPGTCFVAMSFHETLNPAYDDGIRPAVADDCGFDLWTEPAELRERLAKRIKALLPNPKA